MRLHNFRIVLSSVRMYGLILYFSEVIQRLTVGFFFFLTATIYVCRIKVENIALTFFFFSPLLPLGSIEYWQALGHFTFSVAIVGIAFVVLQVIFFIASPKRLEFPSVLTLHATAAAFCIAFSGITSMHKHYLCVCLSNGRSSMGGIRCERVFVPLSMGMGSLSYSRCGLYGKWYGGNR